MINFLSFKPLGVKGTMPISQPAFSAVRIGDITKSSSQFFSKTTDGASENLRRYAAADIASKSEKEIF